MTVNDIFVGGQVKVLEHERVEGRGGLHCILDKEQIKLITSDCGGRLMESKFVVIEIFFLDKFYFELLVTQNRPPLYLL